MVETACGHVAAMADGRSGQNISNCRKNMEALFSLVSSRLENETNGKTPRTLNALANPKKTVSKIASNVKPGARCRHLIGRTRLRKIPGIGNFTINKYFYFA